MSGANQPLVYVSYAWTSRSDDGKAVELRPSSDRDAIVEELCRVLDQEDQIVVGRDKKLVKTGGLIVDFAGDIARGGLILAVISHSSLRSDWCMVHELLQVFRRRSFDTEEFGSDVLALVLEDAEADFEDETSLIDFWQEKTDRDRRRLDRTDSMKRLSPESRQDVDYMEDMLSRLPDLLRVFKRRSMPRGAKAIREEGFQEIRHVVLQRLTEKGSLSQSKPFTIANNQSPKRRHVYISYAHEDRKWADQLKRVIAPLLGDSHQELRLWNNSRIEAAMNWREEIATALAEAKVVLLLVSAYFLASEYLMNEQVPKLLAAAEVAGLRVLWVSLSPCSVEQTLIWNYQAALPPALTLAEMSQQQLQLAMKTLSERILEALQAPPIEREQELEESLVVQLFVEDNETISSEQIIRWRTRCRIWKEPLTDDCDVPMAWIPSDTAQKVGEFLLGVEPVTLRQWQVVAGWPQQERQLNPNPTQLGAPDQPVTGINQEQAMEFCRRMAVRSGRYYELPSEEQWEHACRAGSASLYSWGDTWSVNMATAYANPWGLQKMHGSVWQWCRGEALRGGSWNEPFERCQASSRATAKDLLHPSSVGLRLSCLPFGTPFFRLEASKSQWRPLITRAACAQVLGRPLNESDFIQLVQVLQRFRILGILQLRLFLSLLADRLGDGSDDPEQPLSLEPDHDRISPLPPSVSNDVFTLAASAWQERGWHRLADQAKAPWEVLAELGLAGSKRQQPFLQAVDRAAAAFPEPM